MAKNIKSVCVLVAICSVMALLLAGTNNACGCKVIFVDDMIPCGTQIK